VAQLRPGDTLEERYRIERVLRGEGGESEVTVYLAEDTEAEGREVAITEVVDLLPSHAWRLAAESAFQANVPTLRLVQHPALVAVFDTFNVGRRHYLVTEYVPGESLQAVLDGTPGQPAFAPDQVRDWAIALCSALQHLHSQNPPVILRDLSPAGMLLTEAGTLKLADFGFTRMFLSSNVQTLAAPGYAPPEQYGSRPQPPDARSDIYALGATLHYLLTGRDPGLTPFVFPDAAALNPAVPPELARIVARAVALEPGGRYPSAEAMLADLRAFKNQPRPGPPPPVPPPLPPPVPEPKPAPVARPGVIPVSPPRRRQRRNGPGGIALLAALAALLLLLLVAFAALSGALPFGGGGTASPTVPLATATRPAPRSPTVPLVALPPTATPFASMDSPVPVITFTPTAALPLLSPTPAPSTATPPLPTAPPTSATATPAPPTAIPTPPNGTPVPTRYGVVQETAVNVRAAPGFGGRVLGQANRGDIIEVLEIRSVDGNPWYRLVWNAQEGWIVGTYLRIYDTRPAAQAAATALPTVTATP
jgi:serine/threonine protein kinase